MATTKQNTDKLNQPTKSKSAVSIVRRPNPQYQEEHDKSERSRTADSNPTGSSLCLPQSKSSEIAQGNFDKPDNVSAHKHVQSNDKGHSSADNAKGTSSITGSPDNKSRNEPSCLQEPKEEGHEEKEASLDRRRRDLDNQERSSSDQTNSRRQGAGQAQTGAKEAKEKEATSEAQIELKLTSSVVEIPADPVLAEFFDGLIWFPGCARQLDFKTKNLCVERSLMKLPTDKAELRDFIDDLSDNLPFLLHLVNAARYEYAMTLSSYFNNYHSKLASDIDNLFEIHAPNSITMLQECMSASYSFTSEAHNLINLNKMLKELVHTLNNIRTKIDRPIFDISKWNNFNNLKNQDPLLKLTPKDRVCAFSFMLRDLGFDDSLSILAFDQAWKANVIPPAVTYDYLKYISSISSYPEGEKWQYDDRCAQSLDTSQILTDWQHANQTSEPLKPTPSPKLPSIEQVIQKVEEEKAVDALVSIIDDRMELEKDFPESKVDKPQPLTPMDQEERTTFSSPKGSVTLVRKIFTGTPLNPRIKYNECRTYYDMLYRLNSSDFRQDLPLAINHLLLATMVRNFNQRGEEFVRSMLLGWQDPPYLQPYISYFYIASPEMMECLGIISGHDCSGTWEAGAVPVDGSLTSFVPKDTGSIEAVSRIKVRDGFSKPVRTVMLMPTSTPPPTVYSLEAFNLKRGAQKRMYNRFNYESFKRFNKSYYQWLSTFKPPKFSIESTDFVVYASDLADRKMMTQAQREQFLAKAEAITKLYQTDPSSLIDGLLYQMFRKTKVFVKDEFYPKESTLRFIISPSDFTKIVLGTVFRKIEDWLYYNDDSFLKPYLVKGLTPSQIRDKIMKMSAECKFFAETDYSAYEASMCTPAMNMKFSLYKKFFNVDSFEFKIMQAYHKYSISPKEVFNKNFTLELNPMTLSGMVDTACGNALMNYINIVFFMNLKFKALLLEGDDALIGFDHEETNARLKFSLFPIDEFALTSNPFDLSFCGHMLDSALQPVIKDETYFIQKMTYAFVPNLSMSKQACCYLMYLRILSAQLLFPNNPIVSMLYEQFLDYFHDCDFKVPRNVYDNWCRDHWWHLQTGRVQFSYSAIPKVPRPIHRMLPEDYVCTADTKLTDDLLLTLDQDELPTFDRSSIIGNVKYYSWLVKDQLTEAMFASLREIICFTLCNPMAMGTSIICFFLVSLVTGLGFGSGLVGRFMNTLCVMISSTFWMYNFWTRKYGPKNWYDSVRSRVDQWEWLRGSWTIHHMRRIYAHRKKSKPYRIGIAIKQEFQFMQYVHDTCVIPLNGRLRFSYKTAYYYAQKYSVRQLAEMCENFLEN